MQHTFRGGLTGHLSKRLIHCKPALKSQQSRKRSLVISAASGEDPYKVLGIPRNADTEQVRRVYKKKIAENKGNEAAIRRIEEAHTALMMSSFSARLSGGAASVDKSIAYADRAKFFPWRPRGLPKAKATSKSPSQDANTLTNQVTYELHKADKKLILYAAAAHGLLASWAVFLRLTAGQQPLVASVVVGAALNSWKLGKIFPSPPSGSEAALTNRQGLKNILRGIGLAVFATFIGCALTFTVPDAIAAQLGKTLPYWFYESETTLITLGTAISNFTVNALYR